MDEMYEACLGHVQESVKRDLPSLSSLYLSINEVFVSQIKSTYDSLQEKKT